MAERCWAIALCSSPDSFVGALTEHKLVRWIECKPLHEIVHDKRL